MNKTQLMQKAGIPAIPGYVPTMPVTKVKNTLTLTPEEMVSEYGNVQRFLKKYGSRIMFDHGANVWFIWNGKYWQKDTQQLVLKFALEIGRDINAEADKLTDLKQKDSVKKWGKQSMGLAKCVNLLKLACAYMPSDEDQFDNNGYLLNVDNVAIDLRTGKPKPHSKDDYCTKIAPVIYDKAAKCPVWLAVLNTLFESKQDLITYFQKVIGYSLTADISEKCFFILWGPGGNNGKTMIINLLRDILGTGYCVTIAPETLMSKKPQGSIRTDLQRLKHNYRIGATSETDEKYRFNSSIIKNLTGKDVITARTIYAKDDEFSIDFKLFIATNPMPDFNLDDKALMSRVRIIPFMYTVPTPDTTLPDRLCEEMSGILNWAIEGCLMWQKERLGAVPGANELPVEVHQESTVKLFIDECCEVGDNFMATTTALYERYTKFHLEVSDGSSLVSLKAFCSELDTCGFYDVDHKRDANYRVGIKIKVSDRAE